MGTVRDGELVVIRGGRFDFTALQRRIHPSSSQAARRSALAPASFIVFDLLAAGGGGGDLRGLPYRARRELLELLLAGARDWTTKHAEAGIEGVVVKRLSHAYNPASQGVVEKSGPRPQQRPSSEASLAR